jgi:acetoin utilization deacetylase AcuC-like enzyme
MAQACRRLAEASAGGRIVAVLEGGYDLDAIGDGVATVLDVWRGRDALASRVTGEAARADCVLDRVRDAHAPYWQL